MPRSPWSPLRRIVTLLVAAVLIEYFVVPQIAGARKALHLVGSVNPGLVAAAVLAEVASLLAYAGLTRAVLPRDVAPPLMRLFRIQLTTFGVSHVVPGGSAAGSGLGYRLLTQEGVPGVAAAFALGTQSLGSAVVLNVLLWIGLVVSIPLRGFNPLYATAAIIGAVLLGVFAGLILLLTRGEQRASAMFMAIARKLRINEVRVHKLVHDLAARLRSLAADRRLLVGAFTWATVNWLLDAAALWIFVAAFGYRVSLDGLIVCYGLANVLAAIPITPGGLGVVEATLVSGLVGFGAPRGQALLGVVAYRLVNFWLPIPFGLASYLSLRLEPGKTRRQRIAAMTEKARLEADDLKSWAERHGLERSGRAPVPPAATEDDGSASPPAPRE